MFARKTTVCVLVCLMAMASYAQASAEAYSQIKDLVALLGDKTFVWFQVNCILDLGPCDPTGKKMIGEYFSYFVYIFIFRVSLAWIFFTVFSLPLYYLH